MTIRLVPAPDPRKLPEFTLWRMVKGSRVAEISMLLGHSELRVTADVYGHLQKQTAARAAQHMDAMLAAR